MAKTLLLALVQEFKQQGGRIDAALLGKPAVAPGGLLFVGGLIDWSTGLAVHTAAG